MNIAHIIGCHVHATQAHYKLNFTTRAVMSRKNLNKVKEKCVAATYSIGTSIPFDPKCRNEHY